MISVLQEKDQTNKYEKLKFLFYYLNSYTRNAIVKMRKGRRLSKQNLLLFSDNSQDLLMNLEEKQIH